MTHKYSCTYLARMFTGISIALEHTPEPVARKAWESSQCLLCWLHIDTLRDVGEERREMTLILRARDDGMEDVCGARAWPSCSVVLHLVKKG